VDFDRVAVDDAGLAGQVGGQGRAGQREKQLAAIRFREIMFTLLASIRGRASALRLFAPGSWIFLMSSC
jgi:hypothetical protein